MGSGLLVGLGGGVVLVLVGLVLEGIEASLDTVRESMLVGWSKKRGLLCKNVPSADGGVAVLGNLLVGLLGSAVGGGLDGVRDIVGGLLDGIHVDGLGLGLIWFGVVVFE